MESPQHPETPRKQTLCTQPISKALWVLPVNVLIQMRGMIRCLSVIACLVLGTGSAAPASADVLEIAPDGSAILRSGGGAVRWIGASGSDGEIALPDDLQLPPDADAAVPAIPIPAAYAAVVARLAAKYDLSPALIEAVVWQESRWQPHVVSRAGAVGLAQLMPLTARALGVDPRDPVANLEGGARFLRAQLDLFDGNLEKALAAYNAGPARVLKADAVPAIPETRAYVTSIVSRLTKPLHFSQEQN